MLASLQQSNIPRLEMADGTTLCKCPDQMIEVCPNMAPSTLVKILSQSPPAQCPCACSQEHE